MGTLDKLAQFKIEKESMAQLIGAGRYYYCITYWEGGDSSGAMVEDIYSGDARDRVWDTYRDQGVADEVDFVTCL